MSCPNFTALWKAGVLFHRTRRYPVRRGKTSVDRIAGILSKGLLAPTQGDPEVVSDLSMAVTGTNEPYHDFVFLHRLCKESEIYLLHQGDVVFFIFDADTPYQTVEQMGENWPMLSLDEVYVKHCVELRYLRGMIVDSDSIDELVQQFGPRLHELNVLVFDYAGEQLFPR